jgi:hypothetical protein
MAALQAAIERLSWLDTTLGDMGFFILCSVTFYVVLRIKQTKE